MKTSNRTILSLIILLSASTTHAQAFQDLDFESATLSPAASGNILNVVPVGSALPGWTAYIGAVQQTEVLQNDYGHGEALVIIFGPNYPAAGTSPGINPGTIDGNYSVLLQAGAGSPFGGSFANASIEQYGTIPHGDQSLQFEAWTYPGTLFSVSFDGNALSPVVLGSGANYTLYGADISAFAGQPGTLEFTSVFNIQSVSWLGLEDIAFSPTTITPEPSIVALTAMGGLLFGARKWFVRR